MWTWLALLPTSAGFVPPWYPRDRLRMDSVPGYWETVGDLVQTARQALIQTTSGDNLLAQEAYDRKCAALTKELAGPQPSPLERLLVERIVLCWLHLYSAEALYAQHRQEISLRQAAFHQQRLCKAQARYLAAIRTLAQVRRLGVPAVHVNIGQQQVITGVNFPVGLCTAALALGLWRGGLCTVSPACGCGAGRGMGWRGRRPRLLPDAVRHRRCQKWERGGGCRRSPAGLRETASAGATPRALQVLRHLWLRVKLLRHRGPEALYLGTYNENVSTGLYPILRYTE
jgi:hypothetical protein